MGLKVKKFDFIYFQSFYLSWSLNLDSRPKYLTTGLFDRVEFSLGLKSVQTRRLENRGWFSSESIHRSRASLIVARVGDYARGTVARSSLGNCPSIPELDVHPQPQCAPPALPPPPPCFRSSMLEPCYLYDWLVNIGSPPVWPWLSISPSCLQLTSPSLISAASFLPPTYRFNCGIDLR